MGLELTFLGEVEQDSLECFGVVDADCGDELPSMKAIAVKVVLLGLHEGAPLGSLG